MTTAGAPREAIERMSAEFGKALKTEEVLKLFANLAAPPLAHLAAGDGADNPR